MTNIGIWIFIESEIFYLRILLFVMVWVVCPPSPPFLTLALFLFSGAVAGGCSPRAHLLVEPLFPGVSCHTCLSSSHQWVVLKDQLVFSFSPRFLHIDGSVFGSLILQADFCFAPCLTVLSWLAPVKGWLMFSFAIPVLLWWFKSPKLLLLQPVITSRLAATSGILAVKVGIICLPILHCSLPVYSGVLWPFSMFSAVC